MPKQAIKSKARELLTLVLYPVFLGMAPVFGKMAYNGGSDPFTVAALRTVASASILWITYLLFWRQYIYIYPAGLLGCVVVGTVNGIGSLFYYNGLHYLNASVAQLLNATYLIFMVILAWVSGQPLTPRTIIRAVLALLAVILITQGFTGQFSWLGAGLMIGNALLFAGTFILSQRVLYEMPSQTVALYVLTTMAVVVVMARVVYRLEWIPQSGEALTAILALGLSTALSRLTMFFSVKRMGSIQTVLLGITETAVSLIMAFLFLGESLTTVQWVGVGIFLVSLLLIRRHELDKRATGEMPVFMMTGLGGERAAFNRIAFRQAFGKDEHKVDEVTPEEMEMIRRMMEAPPRYDNPRAAAQFAQNSPDSK
jgi:drug/metabolite transporter (DMT)-like permease